MLSSPSVPPINVEKSYRRLLNHLPGMAYRCRILNIDAPESDYLQYELEFVSKGSYELLGVPAEDMRTRASLSFLISSSLRLGFFIA